MCHVDVNGVCIICVHTCVSVRDFILYDQDMCACFQIWDMTGTNLLFKW